MIFCKRGIAQSRAYLVVHLENLRIKASENFLYFLMVGNVGGYGWGIVDLDFEGMGYDCWNCCHIEACAARDSISQISHIFSITFSENRLKIGHQTNSQKSEQQKKNFPPSRIFHLHSLNEHELICVENLHCKLFISTFLFSLFLFVNFHFYCV